MKAPTEPSPAQRIRAEAKEATRRALLAAGLSEAVERPGLVPSIDAICARAGYTRGAFYVYFKGRDDFVDQMLEWVLGDIFETLFQAVGGDGPDIQTIVTRFTEALARRQWPDVPDIRAAYLRLVSGLGSSEPIRRRHTDLMKAALSGLELAIRQGQEAGRIRETPNPANISQIFLLLGLGLIVWDDQVLPIDPTVLGNQLLDLMKNRPAQ